MKRWLKWNPELAKNVWLELSPQRLIVMPSIIALITLLLLTNITRETRQSIYWESLIGIIAIGMIWGVKNAADSFLDEHNDKTWDWQRMSIIGPWKLAWGKLFGSTIYNWYGALIFFFLYLFSAFDADNSANQIKTGISLLLGMIAVQGLVIITSLQLIKKSDGRAKIRSSGILITGIILVVMFSNMLIKGVFYGVPREHSWYGIMHNPADILLLTLTFYATWIVAGLYRCMRSELLFSDSPTWWVTFLISAFFMNYGYFAGAPETGLSQGLAIAFALTFTEFLFIVYLLALIEPKDPVDFRLLINTWKKRDFSTFFRNVPLWLTTLPIAFVFGLLFAITIQFVQTDYLPGNFANGFSVEYVSKDKAFLMLIAIIGFVIRDLGILLILHLSRRSRRANAAMLIYLLLLYFLLPALMRNLGTGMIFYPDFKANGFAMIIPPIIEATIVLFILRNTWKQYSQGFN